MLSGLLVKMEIAVCIDNEKKHIKIYRTKLILKKQQQKLQYANEGDKHDCSLQEKTGVIESSIDCSISVNKHSMILSLGPL